MTKISLKFWRLSAAFEEVARTRLCESSGSEHSAAEEEKEKSEDLSELVDSFLERESGGEGEWCEESESEEERGSCYESKRYGAGLERKKLLLSLIGGEDEGGERRRIWEEVESAWRSLGSGSTEEEFKRRVMSWLRHKGFDAGLCKSRWEKTAQSPAGDHQYIDVISAGTRYLVEISPAAQFTIARPTDHYASLLEAFPRILVLREDILKAVVRLICAAMRESLKERGMHVPPWRRNAYLQAKWLGPYKRTANVVLAATKVGWAGRSLVGFETVQVSSNGCCRGELVRKVGFGVDVVGNLNGMHL
ncbi:uncharacterized protein LOC130789263 [Actinidia eriantha]|uniref:uncharacterized protein LOC130789263 n=1 Tax=Actinidia eriantha TaxID=165200 RepID=UPI0025839ABC|nr:uncharacterized protein LOC130789263 [Actinidia eriantha]